MIAFPEGTTALSSDDEARLLKKWNQLWYNAYGNVGTVPYPEGTEPLPGDDAHRSLVKLQALKRAANGPTYGPNLLPASYPGEGSVTLMLEVGATYLWTKGANDDQVRNYYDGYLYAADTGTFVVINGPNAGQTVFYGNCSDCPLTGNLKKQLS